MKWDFYPLAEIEGYWIDNIIQELKKEFNECVKSKIERMAPDGIPSGYKVVIYENFTSLNDKNMFSTKLAIRLETEENCSLLCGHEVEIEGFGSVIWIIV